MEIRIARQSDLKQLTAIYNQAITDGNCTADITPLSTEDRQGWFDNHSPQKYPVFVTEEGETISGWCSLSAHRKGRMALKNVAEISYYVNRSYRRQGVGTKLMLHALRIAPECGLHNLFAILLDTNQVSIALLEKYGFKQWGHLPDIVEFPDRTCGQFIYGRKV